MKPWEHLIKLTAMEFKKKKKKPTSILSLMFIRSQLRTLKIRDQQVSEAAGVPGCPCQAVGQRQKNRNKKWGGGRRKDSRTHAEKCQRLLPKTSSRAGQENECYILGLKTDSEVKYQGHSGQSPCLKHRHRLSSYLKMILSWKQQRNMGQGAQHNDHKPLANIPFLYKYFIYYVLGAGIEQSKKKVNEVLDSQRIYIQAGKINNNNKKHLSWL